jgi:hypothetical protein
VWGFDYEIEKRPAGVKVVVHDATNLDYTTFEVHYHAEPHGNSERFYHCEKFFGVSQFLSGFDYLNCLGLCFDRDEALRQCKLMGYKK